MSNIPIEISWFSKKVLYLQSLKGEMLEWLKRHAWKACDRHKRFRSSNLLLSALFWDHSSAGLERLLDRQEVSSPNLLGPTKFFKKCFEMDLPQRSTFQNISFQSNGDVLVLTALTVDCKHAGRRKFARYQQLSNNSRQLQLFIRLLVLRQDCINPGRQGCDPDVYPSAFRPVMC